MNSKKRISLFATLFALLLAIPVFSGCGDDDDDNNAGGSGDSPAQKFGSLSYNFVTTANPEFMEMATMTMEVKRGDVFSQTLTLGSKGRVSFRGETNVCPTELEVTLNVQRKADFVPDHNKQYDVKIGFAYTLKAYDKEGNLLEGVMPLSDELSVLHLEDLDMSKLDAFFSEYLLGDDGFFPITYRFRLIEQNGKYVLDMP